MILRKPSLEVDMSDIRNEAPFDSDEDLKWDWRRYIENKEMLAQAKDSELDCPKGHPYSGSNLYTHPTGYRLCRACLNEGKRRRRVELQDVTLTRI